LFVLQGFSDFPLFSTQFNNYIISGEM